MISDEERNIAHELAHALNDRLSIGYYQKCAKEIPHDVLRDALARTLAVSDADVLQSRARIFTSIIKRYKREIHAGARH
jgi:hypothetical protein